MATIQPQPIQNNQVQNMRRRLEYQDPLHKRAQEYVQRVNTPDYWVTKRYLSSSKRQSSL